MVHDSKFDDKVLTNRRTRLKAYTVLVMFRDCKLHQKFIHKGGGDGGLVVKVLEVTQDSRVVGSIPTQGVVDFELRQFNLPSFSSV